MENSKADLMWSASLSKKVNLMECYLHNARSCLHWKLSRSCCKLTRSLYSNQRLTQLNLTN